MGTTAETTPHTPGGIMTNEPLKATQPLSCPFCGGQAETDLMQPFRHYRTGEPLSQPAVYCTVCSAQIAHYPGDVDLSRDETMDLALTAWNTRAVNSHHELIEALREARKIIADIDDYMKRPGCGDWGEECACCMGELLDDDRAAIAKIDATLTKAEAGHG